MQPADRHMRDACQEGFAMSRSRSFLIGAASVLAIASASVASAHEGGYYNDGKRQKYSHPDGVEAYQLTADQKMQFELFASGFENRERRIGRERRVVPVPYFKFKLHTHYYNSTEMQITIRYMSHATTSTRTYLKEWRDPVQVSGNVERTEWWPMGVQVPAGRYMVEAWFYEKRQTQEVRRKMWEPRDSVAEEAMTAGKEYDTKFFYMTPPCDYCRTTSMNEILVHGEAGDYRATAMMDQQCKDEIALIHEQMTRVARGWDALKRQFDKSANGKKIEQNQWDDWQRAEEAMTSEIKAVREEQLRFRDAWLFSRFPDAWDHVDTGSREIAEAMFGLRAHIVYKAQDTNPELVLGREPIEKPGTTAKDMIEICEQLLQRHKDQVGAVKSNIKAHFRKLQSVIQKSEEG
jgi:hypothetical protein